MPDRSNNTHGDSSTCPKNDQIDRIAELCDQLNRTIRGNNGQVGLITQVALLVEQCERIDSGLADHVREHQEDRAKQKTSHLQILERVILWLLVALLSLAMAGGRLENFKEIAPMIQGQTAQ